MPSPEILRQAYETGFAKGKTILNGGATVADGVRYWRDSAACLAQAVGCPAETLIAAVQKYHRERLEAEPDLTMYPELRGYAGRLQAEQRGMLESGVPADVVALAGTLEFWRTTRLFEQTGIAYYAQPLAGQCRVLFLAESDRGALRLKNVDDPLGYWKPRPPIPAGSPWPVKHPLTFDGVSSGLHMDEIPPEIFPVNVHALCQEHCTTVRDATEFMVHYGYFWRGQNLLIHDTSGNSMALEKTACRVATRGPNSAGINYVNEMGALDEGIATFQKSQRQKYLDQIGEEWTDSAHGSAFTMFETQWSNLTSYVQDLSLNPTWDNAKQVMEQRDPAGPMCLTGQKQHPRQAVTGCTLIMDIYELDNRRLHRRQWRGTTPAYLDTPEIVQFT